MALAAETGTNNSPYLLGEFESLDFFSGGPEGTVTPVPQEVFRRGPTSSMFRRVLRALVNNPPHALAPGNRQPLCLFAIGLKRLNKLTESNHALADPSP